MSKPSWQEIAKTAQKHRDVSIAEVKPAIPEVPPHLPHDATCIPKDLLTQKEVEITETTAEGLVTLLATGKLKSADVTNAFLRRAGLAQKLVSFRFLYENITNVPG